MSCISPFIYNWTRLRVHATRATTQRVFITRARVHVWSYGQARVHARIKITYFFWPHVYTTRAERCALLSRVVETCATH